jgi:hypothetical protein
MKIIDKLRQLFTGKPKSLLTDEERARLIALLAADPAAAKQLLAGARAVAQAKQPAAGAPGDVPGSQWQTAPPRSDPWYRDDRRGAPRGSSWIPSRPGWLQAGSAGRGRGAQQQSAAIIRPNGEVQQVAAPDYQPTPFVPPDK